MKKFGFLLFAAALVIGVVVSSIFSFGRMGSKIANFSFNFGSGVQGSGNVIKETRDLSGFTKVEVGGVFQVEITKGSEYRVEIESDDNLMPLINTEVSGDTLTLSTEKSFKGKNTLRVRITAPDIDGVNASGAAKVALSGVDNDSLSVEASGASQIKADGRTDELTVELSGASRLTADSLTAANASIDASGASNADVKVTGDLNSDISGASHVNYSGTPANVHTKKSGASSVSAK